jgi:hypothetical protein
VLCFDASACLRIGGRCGAVGALLVTVSVLRYVCGSGGRKWVMHRGEGTWEAAMHAPRVVGATFVETVWETPSNIRINSNVE